MTLLCDTRENLGDFLPGEPDREGFLKDADPSGCRRWPERWFPEKGEGRHRRLPLNCFRREAAAKKAPCLPGYLFPSSAENTPSALPWRSSALRGLTETGQEKPGMKLFPPSPDGETERFCCRTTRRPRPALEAPSFPLQPYWISRLPITFFIRRRRPPPRRAVHGICLLSPAEKGGFLAASSGNSRGRWGTTRASPPSWSRRIFPSFLSSWTWKSTASAAASPPSAP